MTETKLTFTKTCTKITCWKVEKPFLRLFSEPLTICYDPQTLPLTLNFTIPQNINSAIISFHGVCLNAALSRFSSYLFCWLQKTGVPSGSVLVPFSSPLIICLVPLNDILRYFQSTGTEYSGSHYDLSSRTLTHFLSLSLVTVTVISN